MKEDIYDLFFQSTLHSLLSVPNFPNCTDLFLRACFFLVRNHQWIPTQVVTHPTEAPRRETVLIRAEHLLLKKEKPVAVDDYRYREVYLGIKTFLACSWLKPTK